MIAVFKEKAPVRRTRHALPWDTMKIGESFIIPWPEEPVVTSGQSYVGSVKRLAPKKFKYAHSAKGIHIWRIA